MSHVVVIMLQHVKNVLKVMEARGAMGNAHGMVIMALVKKNYNAVTSTINRSSAPVSVNGNQQMFAGKHYLIKLEQLVYISCIQIQVVKMLGGSTS